MSRVTHFANQSKNILYWDYYILCRLDTDAAIVMQRLEYWDGIKNSGNALAEAFNDVALSEGGEATQDTSQFFYKSQEELKWELMGLIGTNQVATKLKFLTTELLYVVARNNPTDPTDRKKQYHLADSHVQMHLSYLAYMLEAFQKAGYRMNTVCYAIEDLTREKVYIEDLSIKVIAKKLVSLYKQAEIDDLKAIEDREQQKALPKGAKKPKPYEPVLPKFIRVQLKKDRQMLSNINLNTDFPTFNFKEWETLKLKNDQALKIKTLIPQNQRISSNYSTNNDNQKLQTSERTADVSQPDTGKSSPPSKNPDVILMDTWDDICGERIPRDKKHKEAAIELARCGATRENLINCRDFCLRTNPQWYEKNGVDLAAIARNWGKWKSSLSHANKGKQSTMPAQDGMTEDEANTLAIQILEAAEMHNLDIQAHADRSKKTDAWLVRMVWDGANEVARSQKDWQQLLMEELSTPTRKEVM